MKADTLFVGGTLNGKRFEIPDCPLYSIPIAIIGYRVVSNKPPFTTPVWSSETYRRIKRVEVNGKLLNTFVFAGARYALTGGRCSRG
jgi:hypothetical protein